MSPEKRSAVMARIRGKDTGPELAMAAALRPTRFRYESHARDLPGRPDFVFRRHGVVVFVDGDFWHGWRFRDWRDKLSEKWETKIEANRQRDLRNFRRLRAEGWRVLRIWEHEVKADANACAARVVQAIRSGRKQPLDASKRLALAAQPGTTIL